MASWEGQPPDGAAQDLIGDVLSTGGPSSRTGGAYAYAAALPVMRREEVAGVMLILGDARDPFTALDTRFLRALGQQVGAALENADLGRRLRRRTAELERLSTRMVQQHEEERRRLSLELHDETAQVFSAVKLRLGLVREQVPAPQADQLGRVVELVDAGMASIRSVTEALRPSLLDDLGLLPAIRALAGDFEARTGVRTTFAGPEELPRLSEFAELALFRAVQEGLSNIARHAEAEMATVDLAVDAGHLTAEIRDDGTGPGDTPTEERMGLTGMRERVAALGGASRSSEARGGEWNCGSGCPSTIRYWRHERPPGAGDAGG